ncbi:hypothetical protein pipiens_017886 [Culex pipiens pipiens]|uniref:Uncharacterized protein n=1 Tax=Culex pipiens pipiens TaxID=38569 RepID=A0ABD1CEK7_CULPP
MKVSCELDPAPIGKNIPAPIEEMFQAKIRGVMTESGKQFVTYFRPRRNASEVTQRPGRRNASTKDKFSADQSPVPSWWNSHITYSLPAAKNNFQTTHGLVQTHPSFGKPAHRPAGSHRSPTRAPGLPCPLGRVPRRRTAEDLLLLYRGVLHRAGSYRQIGGRSERSKRFKEVWSKLVDTCFEDVGAMDKALCQLKIGLIKIATTESVAVFPRNSIESSRHHNYRFPAPRPGMN